MDEVKEAGYMKDAFLEKETLPLYRHKELYDWNEKYQAHKFFTDEDFENEKKLYELKCKGEDDYEFAHNNSYDRMDFIEWRYKDRYACLKSDTVFSNNLHKLRDIRENSISYSEYVLKASIRGIDQKYVNFELLYAWFARRRYFSYDYLKEKANIVNPTPYSRQDYKRWLSFREMCKEAFKDGHVNCCKYAEFIKYRL